MTAGTMSCLEEKDFADLRVHFSNKQWNKMKEVQKIIYLNQKSNHLFKLSVGLKSRVPDFMKISTPQPRKKKTREDEDEEWMDSDEESGVPDNPPPVKKRVAVPTNARNLRNRTNVVNYSETNHREMETEEEASTSDRSLRNRTNVVTYTEPEVPEPTEDDYLTDDTDEGTSGPQPRKKKRGEENEDEECIPSDEESVERDYNGPPEFIEDVQRSPIAAGDATETVKVSFPRVILSRLSGDCLRNNSTETVKVSFPRVVLSRLSGGLPS